MEGVLGQLWTTLGPPGRLRGVTVALLLEGCVQGVQDALVDEAECLKKVASQVRAVLLHHLGLEAELAAPEEGMEAPTTPVVEDELAGLEDEALAAPGLEVKLAAPREEDVLPLLHPDASPAAACSAGTPS